MEAKLEAVASSSDETSSISTAVATCLKWGAFYGAIVMLVAQHLTQASLADSALFIGVPAGLVACIAMARRLDRGLPSRPIELPSDTEAGAGIA
ncbi:hypothetical protein BH10PSE17_BH10PSE17_00270 [soil metagenome]